MPPLEGVAPFLTGVAGGKVRSNCSGLSCGPKDTLLRLALGICNPVENFLFRLPESFLESVKPLPLSIGDKALPINSAPFGLSDRGLFLTESGVLFFFPVDSDKLGDVLFVFSFSTFSSVSLRDSLLFFDTIGVKVLKLIFFGESDWDFCSDAPDDGDLSREVGGVFTTSEFLELREFKSFETSSPFIMIDVDLRRVGDLEVELLGDGERLLLFGVADSSSTLFESLDVTSTFGELFGLSGDAFLFDGLRLFSTS